MSFGVAATAEDDVSRGRRAPVFVILVILLFAAFSFQLWYHATRSSPTIDEGAHILAGHRHWQCGDFGINPEHPPLLKLLATASLNARTLNEPDWPCGSRLTSKPDLFTYGNRLLVENGVDSVVIPARLSAALMSLLLAFLVFFAAWEMFGRVQALTALALLAFEPNLIAEGALVTTDMVLSATALAAVYALYRYRNKANWVRLSIVGLSFGLLLAAKHSAVVFIPILFGLLIADVLIFNRSAPGLPRRLFRQTAAFAACFLIGLTLLWATYGFRYSSLPHPTEPAISIADFMRQNARPEMVDSVPARMTEAISHLHIFPESYVLGMADVIAWGSRNTFIFGQNYPTGKWFYFPVAFAVKSSVALLLLLPFGLLFPFFNPGKRREAMYMLAPPLLFFAVSLTSALNIGVRHILPVYPFLIIVATAGAVWLCQRFYLMRYILIALLAFHAAAAIRTAPNYIAFSNDFFGGTNNTYKIFVDSNVDTGQSIKLVDEYLARENITDCWFVAFAHPELIGAIQPCRVLPSGLRVFVSQSLIEPVPPVIEGTVLVSVNELPPRGGDEYVPIARSQPIAQIGGNTFVYQGRFEIPLAAAISRTYRAVQLMGLNRVDEAVAEGREAVRLAPSDPRTHLSLGLVLIRAGQKDEARRELEAAAGLAASDPVFRNAEVKARQEIERLGGN